MVEDTEINSGYINSREGEREGRKKKQQYPEAGWNFMNEGGQLYIKCLIWSYKLLNSFCKINFSQNSPVI